MAIAAQSSTCVRTAPLSHEDARVLGEKLEGFVNGLTEEEKTLVIDVMYHASQHLADAGYEVVGFMPFVNQSGHLTASLPSVVTSLNYQINAYRAR